MIFGIISFQSNHRFKSRLKTQDPDELFMEKNQLQNKVSSIEYYDIIYVWTIINYCHNRSLEW